MKVQVCVSEGASGTVTAVFGVGSVEVGVGIKWGRRRRIDFGDHGTVTFVSRNSVPVSFPTDRTVSTLIRVFVSDPTHRTAITHVVTTADERKELERTGANWTGAFRSVILLIGVRGMLPIAVIDRGQAHRRRDDVATGGFRSIMVNDVVDPWVPCYTIVCVDLG